MRNVVRMCDGLRHCPGSAAMMTMILGGILLIAGGLFLLVGLGLIVGV